MPIVDRLPFPRKYKLHQGVVLLVVLAALFGLWLRSQSRKALGERVIIHSIGIERYDTQFVEINFEIENKGKKAEDVMLLARIYDPAGDEIASKLFQIALKPSWKGPRSHILDKMTRPLKPGEKPYRATMELRTR